MSEVKAFTFVDGQVVEGLVLQQFAAVIDSLATKIEVTAKGDTAVLKVHYREDFEGDRTGHEL
jgi:hypothetical protein